MIAWDLRDAREHPGVAAGEPPRGFLSAPERVFFGRLRTPRRRQEWLLGRWAAKALVRAWLRNEGRDVPAEAITVAPDADGAPFVLVAGEGRLPMTLSLSHRGDLGLCAMTAGRDAPLGADLELCEPRPDSFVQDFFTPSEIEAIHRSPDLDRATTEAWCLKEAALKAVKLGLRADTRHVEVAIRSAPRAGWMRTPVELALPDLRAAGQAFVRDHGAFILSVAWLGAEGVREPTAALRGCPVLGDGVAGHPLCRMERVEAPLRSEPSWQGK